MNYPPLNAQALRHLQQLQQRLNASDYPVANWYSWVGGQGMRISNSATSLVRCCSATIQFTLFSI